MAMVITEYENLLNELRPRLKFLQFEPGGQAYTCFDLILQRHVVVINGRRYLCRTASEALYIKTLYNAGYLEIGVPEDVQLIERLIENFNNEATVEQNRS